METTFPNVGTLPTKGLDEHGRDFVTAKTQTADGQKETEIHIYWHVPEDGGEPYLMVEVDDFTGLPMKVMVNEGTLYNTSDSED